MSQVSKHVNWCLNKAEKEIDECRKLGKRPKHGGLLKVEPNFEEAKKHVEKSEHNLEVTEYLKKGNFLDTSASTIFYSMYHCFLAIISKFGYESGNQSCTISLIEHLKEKNKINLDAKFIDIFKYGEDKKEGGDSLIEIREDYTYSTKLSFNKEKVDELISTCKELIDATKAIIFE